MLIEWAVYQEVFDGFNCYALTVGTDWCIRLANAEEVMVETDVSCSELEEN